MAEGFARHFGDSFLEVYSAGLHPTGRVSDAAIRAMDEKGIDILGQSSKGLDDVPLDDMDFVVSLAGVPAEDICPASFAGATITWQVADPIGGSSERFRVVRDEIEQRVKQLVEDIAKRGAPGGDDV